MGFDLGSPGQPFQGEFRKDYWTDVRYRKGTEIEVRGRDAPLSNPRTVLSKSPACLDGEGIDGIRTELDRTRRAFS